MGGSAKGQTFTHFEKYLPNTQVPELLIYDETQYVVDRLDEVPVTMMMRRMMVMMRRMMMMLMKSFDICWCPV